MINLFSVVSPPLDFETVCLSVCLSVRHSSITSWGEYKHELELGSEGGV